MRRTLRRSLVWMVCWLLLGVAAPAFAQIHKMDPTTHPFAPKYSSAFDSVNGVYLIVAEGPPVRGQFVDRNGTPLGAMFNISLETAADYPYVAWSTVTFGGTLQDPAFLVTYLAIEGTPVAKYGRLVRYQPAGAPPLVSGRTQIVANVASEWYAADRATSVWNGVDFIVSTRVVPPGQALPQTQLRHFLLDGQLTAPQYLGDGLDYEGGPSVACAPFGPCMATGYAAGYPVGANTAIWARQFDATTLLPTTPLFYMDNQSSPVDTPQLTYASHLNKFQAAWYRRTGSRIDFRTIDLNGTMSPLQMNKSFGGGAGEPQLVYNGYTKTSLLLTKGGNADFMAMELGDDGFPLSAAPIILTPWDGYVLEYRPSLAASAHEPRWLTTYMLQVGGQGAIVQGTALGPPPAPPTPPPPPDADADGVPDAADACPSVKAKTLTGCKLSGDYNDDDKPDVVFQFATNPGVVASWRLQGLDVVGGSYLINDPQLLVGPGWAIVGTSDFTGDNKSDLLYQNQTTGEVILFFMHGTNYLGVQQQITPENPDWRIMATGDFNKDGHADLLWENFTTGGIYVLYMTSGGGIAVNPQQGTLLLQSNGAPFPTGPSSWRIVGTGDADGDGYLDLVWQDTATGNITMWFLQNATFKGSTPVLVLNEPNWRIRSVSDFNGDGRPDVIFHNSATGQIAGWLLNGINILQGQFMGQTVDWQVVGAK